MIFAILMFLRLNPCFWLRSVTNHLACQCWTSPAVLPGPDTSCLSLLPVTHPLYSRIDVELSHALPWQRANTLNQFMGHESWRSDLLFTNSTYSIIYPTLTHTRISLLCVCCAGEIRQGSKPIKAIRSAFILSRICRMCRVERLSLVGRALQSQSLNVRPEDITELDDFWWITAIIVCSCSLSAFLF